MPAPNENRTSEAAMNRIVNPTSVEPSAPPNAAAGMTSLAALSSRPGLSTSTRLSLRVVKFAKQAGIVLAALALVAWLALSVRAGLARNGIGFDMGFLRQAANFDISEGYIVTWKGIRSFTAADTNAEALLAGFYNTIKTAAVSIVLATVLGLLVGMARISHNWLVRQLSFGFVELARNTPMLIQLVFWYFAVVLQMPALTDASRWFGGILFSKQGLYVPAVALAEHASNGALWSLFAGTAFALAAFAARKVQRMGHLFLALSAAALVAAIALGFPLTVATPHVDGFLVDGGVAASPEFAALFLGLSVYTAAFIAEIVRGAILALPKGQWEAAAALGLSRRYAFRDVVIPQVFRVVLPAFGNQYISLAKTTSLGIAIGFSDLFNVYGTVANTSGRNLEGVIVVMLAYLVLSWTISFVVNFVNRRLLLAGASR